MQNGSVTYSPKQGAHRVLIEKWAKERPKLLKLLGRMVEAAGVEPASENIPLRHLHT
jgi:hypothetical protein